jgi:hypothetical protein
MRGIVRLLCSDRIVLHSKDLHLLGAHLAKPNWARRKALHVRRDREQSFQFSCENIVSVQLPWPLEPHLSRGRNFLSFCKPNRSAPHYTDICD